MITFLLFIRTNNVEGRFTQPSVFCNLFGQLQVSIKSLAGGRMKHKYRFGKSGATNMLFLTTAITQKSTFTQNICVFNVNNIQLLALVEERLFVVSHLHIES